MTQRFDTLAVHAGAAPDPTTGARTTPIYQTTSFVFQDHDHAARLFGLQEFGNIYTRIGNPTNAVLEGRLAALEGGTAALAVGSGHAAQLLALHVLMAPGTNLVAARQLYGGSINQFSHGIKKFGWEVRFVDYDDIEGFKAAIDANTRGVFVESLANPGGLITDIEAVAQVAHAAGLPLLVDNTMASPYLCRPIEHGADIVLHSLTKFIGGHGNSIGGAIVDSGRFDWKAAGAKFPTLTQPLDFYQGMVLADAFGAVPIGPGGSAVNIAFAIAARAFSLRDLGPALSPFNAFLLLTGCETLPLRMRRHSDNALEVARWLKRHPKVSFVSYVGLEDDPRHALARKYLPRGAGAVFTFGVHGGYEAGVKVANGVRLFSMLANIGDTRSLIIHPASTTHRQLSDAAKTAAGAGPGVLRLSVGIEDPADLIADLEQALAQA